jgi:hypothetical protein
MAAPALVDIYNLALVRIKERGLLISPDQESGLATTLAASYDITRRALLRQYRWQFAFTRAVLSPSPPAPAFGWAFRMVLPADFLALVAANPNPAGGRETLTDAPETYRIENGCLLADTNTMYVMYIRDEPNPTLWDPIFTNALVWALAADIALGVAGDRELADYARANAAEHLKLGRRAASVEQPAEILSTPERLEERGRFLPGPYPYIGRR